MKVLLIGELFSQNLGDQLIFYCTKKIVKDRYPNAEIVLLDIMGRKEEEINKTYTPIYLETKTSTILAKIRKNQYVHFVLKCGSAKKLNPYYKKIINEDIDFAVFTGGALIKDTFATYIYAIVKELEKKRVPVFFNGIGVGTQTFITKGVFKKVFQNSIIKGVSCRCRIERLDEFVSRSNINVVSTFDVAVLTERLLQNANVEQRNIVGLGIMSVSRFSNEKLIKFWSNIITELNRRKVKWQIFTTGSSDDNMLALKILEVIGGENVKSNKIFPRNVEELVQIISSYDRIISFRLHSHIIAYSLGVPSVGIWWDNKITDFFEKTNHIENVFSIEHNVNNIIDNVLNLEKESKEKLSCNQDITKKIFEQLCDSIQSKGER